MATSTLATVSTRTAVSAFGAAFSTFAATLTDAGAAGAAATAGALAGFTDARAAIAERAAARFVSERAAALARVRAVFVLAVAFAIGFLTFAFVFVFTGLAFTDFRVAPVLPFGAEVATSDFLTRSDLAALAFAEPVLPLEGAGPDFDLGFLTAGFDALDLLFFCAVMG